MFKSNFENKDKNKKKKGREREIEREKVKTVKKTELFGNSFGYFILKAHKFALL